MFSIFFLCWTVLKKKKTRLPLHLADAFKVTYSAFRIYICCHHLFVCSLGIEPMTFCAANTMLYHWATGTFKSQTVNHPLVLPWSLSHCHSVDLALTGRVLTFKPYCLNESKQSGPDLALPTGHIITLNISRPQVKLERNERWRGQNELSASLIPTERLFSGILWLW